MLKICVRFCTCPGEEMGFSYDPGSQLWVHALCGLPKERYYLAVAAEGAVPPLERARWGQVLSDRLEARKSLTGRARGKLVTR